MTEDLQAKELFQFFTASYLIQIGNQKAMNLLDLQKGIEECSDASIFNHTFQSLGRTHFLTEGFSNDFAQWVLASCNQPRLAEQLASLDIRDYTAIADLRGDLRRIVRDYCQGESGETRQPAFEPFYFCETIEEQVPLGLQASTLEELRDCLKALSHASIQFHFLTSRLRLHLHTNDFSYWLEKELGLKETARRVNQIDIYTNTLDSIRSAILYFLERELSR